MKTLLVLIFLGFIIHAGFSQSIEHSLSLDERGKYIYYEVVDSIQVPGDTLIKRAKAFFNSNFSAHVSQEKSAGEVSFQTQGKFQIKKGILVLSHPQGEINYQFISEFKDSKYRFWLTDFIFRPYKRDRYGNFVPDGSLYIQLETYPGKLNEEAWKNNITAAGQQAYLLAENFKKFLSKSSASSIQNKKPSAIIGSKW
ncbi:MAG: DUF4468 domain-containing protein [Daejeonella sp.]